MRCQLWNTVETESPCMNGKTGQEELKRQVKAQTKKELGSIQESSLETAVVSLPY